MRIYLCDFAGWEGSFNCKDLSAMDNFHREKYIPLMSKTTGKTSNPTELLKAISNDLSKFRKTNLDISTVQTILKVADSILASTYGDNPAIVDRVKLAVDEGLFAKLPFILKEPCSLLIIKKVIEYIITNPTVENNKTCIDAIISEDEQIDSIFPYVHSTNRSMIAEYNAEVALDYLAAETAARIFTYAVNTHIKPRCDDPYNTYVYTDLKECSLLSDLIPEISADFFNVKGNAVLFEYNSNTLRIVDDKMTFVAMKTIQNGRLGFERDPDIVFIRPDVYPIMAMKTATMSGATTHTWSIGMGSTSHPWWARPPITAIKTILLAAARETLKTIAPTYSVKSPDPTALTDRGSWLTFPPTNPFEAGSIKEMYASRLGFRQNNTINISDIFSILRKNLSGENVNIYQHHLLANKELNLESMKAFSADLRFFEKDRNNKKSNQPFTLQINNANNLKQYILNAATVGGQDAYRSDLRTFISEQCDERNKEGAYIRASLTELTRFMQSVLLEKANSLHPPLHSQCFDIYSPVLPRVTLSDKVAPPPFFADLRKDDALFCVFGVINLTNKDNIGSQRYISTEKQHIALDIDQTDASIRSSAEELHARLKIELTTDTDYFRRYSAGNTRFTESINMLASKTTQKVLLANAMRYLVDHVDTYNANSQIGILQFLDNISKAGLIGKTTCSAESIDKDWDVYKLD